MNASIFALAHEISPMIDRVIERLKRSNRRLIRLDASIGLIGIEIEKCCSHRSQPRFIHRAVST
jgi:hypothetical protein